MIRSTRFKFITALYLVTLLVIAIESGLAKPGGVYRGFSKHNTFLPDGGSAMTFETTPISLRLPNKKGALRGTLFTTRKALPAIDDVPITGRITKHIVRQKGNKHIYKGRWRWGPFDPVGPSTTDTGKVRITVLKDSRKYKFKPLVNTRLRGTPPDHSFRSKVQASK